MNYINDLEIPESIIEDCNRMAESGTTHYVFRLKDLELFGYIVKDKIAKRDDAINKILDDNDETFIISSSFFSESLFSYYDTETKVLGRYNRYKIVTDFLYKLGFEDGLVNLGLEYEQHYHYTLANSNNINIKLSPNMFINISCWYRDTYTTISGFFSKRFIIKFFQMYLPDKYKEISRDMIIEEVLG